MIPKTLFICGKPPHPVHEAFAKSVNADFYYYDDSSLKNIILSLIKIPKDYDIYLSEGLFSYVALAKILGFIGKKSKIINIFADPRIYQIYDKKKFDLKKVKIRKYPLIKRLIVKCLINKLYGGICVGEYEEKILKELNKKIISKNVPAFIIRKEFFKFTSKLKEDNIIFIGNGPDYYYKGLDFLIEAFCEVNKDNPQVKLFIIGGDWDKIKEKNKKIKNVFFLGPKNIVEIKKYLNKSSVCCHFGRGDTFPVSTIETMASGLPCIVSDNTGTKEIVEKVSKEFVVSMNKKDRAISVIKEYLKKGHKEKIALGKKFKMTASFYNEKNCTNLFKEKFYEIIKENESINDKSSNKDY